MNAEFFEDAIAERVAVCQGRRIAAIGLIAVAVITLTLSAFGA